MALSTISAVLKRIGLGRCSRLEPPNRYERARSSELLQVIDVRHRPSASPGGAMC